MKMTPMLQKVIEAGEVAVVRELYETELRKGGLIREALDHGAARRALSSPVPATRGPVQDIHTGSVAVVTFRVKRGPEGPVITASFSLFSGQRTVVLSGTGEL
jgi:hypothetical protein